MHSPGDRVLDHPARIVAMTEPLLVRSLQTRILR